MTGHLVDSDVIIDALRGRSDAVQVLERELEAADRIHGSTVTKAQVLAGARPKELSRTLAFLDSFEWIPVTEAVANRAGELARAYRRSHPGIDLADYLIAATTMVHVLPLWTRNVKHYPMLRGLKPAYGTPSAR